MNARTLSTAAVDSYLKLLRRPADLIVGLLPGQSTGPGAVARIAVERVDAAARASLASTLGVGLTVDARRRQAAADEREHALDLRRQAQGQETRAEARVKTGNRQAAQRRDRAEKEAGGRRRAATQREQTRTRQAAETEHRRTQATRRQEAKAEELIEAETARQELPAVEDQAKALQEHELATARRQEAERLGEAAAQAKAERKEESNGAGAV